MQCVPIELQVILYHGWLAYYHLPGWSVYVLHVLSLRENELLELPEEIGQLKELTVLDIVGNR